MPRPASISRTPLRIFVINPRFPRISRVSSGGLMRLRFVVGTPSVIAGGGGCLLTKWGGRRAERAGWVESSPLKLIAMPLSREQVRHVAQLARIALEPGDEEFYAEQLSGILEHIDRLQEVPTDDIAPTAQVVEVTNPLREDVPRPGLTQQEVLANAPAAVNGFFRVPSIQEEA